MNKPIVFAFLVAAAVGLSACGKSEEPAQEQKAPETGVVEEGKAMVEQAAEAAKEGAGEAAEKASEMADEAIAKAEELIDQAKEYIENNEIDLAQEVMEQLRKLKDSLPESVQAQIDNLEQMLSSASSAPAPAGGQ